MHKATTGDRAAKMLPNGLVAEADAEQWLACFGTSGNEIKAHTRFIWCFWSRRNQERLRTR